MSKARPRLADLKKKCPQDLASCEGYVWHLGTCIGKGSFGEVFLGWDKVREGDGGRGRERGLGEGGGCYGKEETRKCVGNAKNKIPICMLINQDNYQAAGIIMENYSLYLLSHSLRVRQRLHLSDL